MPRGMEGGELSDEGIQQADSRFFEVPGISRDDRQIEHEREGRDLLVAGVVRVQGHQLPPDMGARRIEREGSGRNILRSEGPSRSQGCEPGKIAPATDHFESLPQHAAQAP